MILVGIVMEFIKNFLPKKLSGILREYILVSINLIVTAVLIIPFCIFKVDLVSGIKSNSFNIVEYFKALLIVALVSGKVYDIFKKQFAKAVDNEKNNDVDKK